MGSLLNQAKKAVTEQKRPVQPAQISTPISDLGHFQAKYELATRLSRSSLIPRAYFNKPEDVMVAMELSESMKMSLFVVLQNIDIIHGRPGWKSTFVLSAINASGRFASRVKFEFTGERGKDTWGCRAYALEHDGTRCEGSWVTMKMARAEGWYDRKDSKWQTMPEQMLQYRAAAFFGRLHASDLLMGMQSTDEIIDVAPMSTETVQANKELFNEELDAEIVEHPFSQLVITATELGYEISDPVAGKESAVWIKATPKRDDANHEELKKLGFRAKNDFFVMEISHLLQ